MGVTGNMAGFCKVYKKFISNETYPKIILGINDAIYYSYFEHGLAVLKRREKPTISGILRLLRALPLAILERRNLLLFDACHVQTKQEHRRLKRIIGSNKLRIIIAQNGINEVLLSLFYTGLNKKNILLMGHMTNGRERQGLWFVEKVWSLVLKCHKDAKLCVVGAPPEKELMTYLSAVEGVNIMGYLPDLKYAYQDMTVSVIPHFQSSGIINRIVDSMAAGVPVIVSKETASTVEGFIPNVHGIQVNGAKKTAIEINRILDDFSRLEHLSIAAREFIKDRFTWENAVEIVEKEMLELHKNDPLSN